MRTAQDLLERNGIRPKSYAPGNYYTTCPQCSAKRGTAEHRAAKVLASPGRGSP